MDFEVVSASVQGWDHRRKGKNNQDALCVLKDDKRLIAVVADGCGSGEFTEVGSRIAAHALASSLYNQGWTDEIGSANLEFFGQMYVLQMQSLVSFVGRYPMAINRRSDEKTVKDFMLATLVGVYIGTETTTFFSIGDGARAINGDVVQWDYAENSPPYLAYNLLRPESADWTIEEMPTADLGSFMIGTDGVRSLVDAADNKKPFPGKDEVTLPMSALWEEDHFFSNGFALQRYLTLLNTDVTRIEDGQLRKHRGLLSDDTTLVVGRRKKVETEHGDDDRLH